MHTCMSCCDDNLAVHLLFGDCMDCCFSIVRTCEPCSMNRNCPYIQLASVHTHIPRHHPFALYCDASHLCTQQCSVAWGVQWGILSRLERAVNEAVNFCIALSDSCTQIESTQVIFCCSYGGTSCCIACEFWTIDMLYLPMQPVLY